MSFLDRYVIPTVLAVAIIYIGAHVAIAAGSALEAIGIAVVTCLLAFGAVELVKRHPTK